MYDYTKGSISWGLARLAVPSLGENVTWNIERVVEVYWVGRLGAEYLAAMAVGFMVVNFLRGLGQGLRISGQALIAQRVGAGDTADASRLAGQVVSFALLYSLPLCLLGLWLAPSIMRMLSSDSRLVEIGTEYLRAGFAAMVCIELSMTLVNVLRGAGEPAHSLTGMAVSTLVSILLIPVFMFGAGPVPAMGLAGSFLAKGFGRLSGAAAMLAIFLSGRSRLRLRLRYLVPRAGVLVRFLRIGWPVAGQNIFERGANMVVVVLLSRFGPMVLAAWGVGNRMAAMARMPGLAVQAATRTLIGQSIGAGRADRAARGAWLALGAVVTVMVGMSLGLFLGAGWLVEFFGLRGKAAEMGVLCLRILSFGALFEAGRRTLAGVFQGAAMTKPPMLVEIFARGFVLLPLAYLLSALLGMGAVGVWGAISTSHIVGSVALFIWFLRGSWRRQAVRAAAGR